jgi:hypothetical protein
MNEPIPIKGEIPHFTKIGSNQNDTIKHGIACFTKDVEN